MPHDNNQTPLDWSSLTADDPNWLNDLEFDPAILEGDGADVDWLASSLNASITGGTTLSMGADSTTAPKKNTPAINLDALLHDEVELPAWDAITAETDLGDWETENSVAEVVSDWTEVPSSVSELARQEAWDEKDRVAQQAQPLSTEAIETAETQEFPPSYTFPYSPPLLEMQQSSPAVPPSPASGLDDVFEQIISERAEDEQVSEFGRPSYLDSFEPSCVPEPPVAGNPLDMDIDIDIDLEDFRSGVMDNTPPLHEAFSRSILPPPPPIPRTNSSQNTDGDQKWNNPQMSTGLNPDRKPFEPAPPALITEVSQAKTPVDPYNFDLFNIDENTDWSGLVGTDTVVEKELPQPTPPSPVVQTKLSPPSYPVTQVKEPEELLYQEVQQFQQLLDDSNLAASVAPAKSYPQVDDCDNSLPPLHGRVQSQVKPPQPLFTMPRLPWGRMATVGGLAVGAIVLLWGGMVILERPVTQFGLRMGWIKDVQGRDLSGMDLSGGNLRGTNFSRANLRGANLKKADLSVTNLAEADVTGADLREAVLRGANVLNMKIGEEGSKEQAKLDREVYLVWQAVNRRKDGLNLSRLNLLGLNFNNASLVRANFTNANVSFATFRSANLTGANFRQANLEGANFTGATLSGANFRDVTFGKNPPTSTETTICPDRKKGPCDFDKFR